MNSSRKDQSTDESARRSRGQIVCFLITVVSLVLLNASINMQQGVLIDQREKLKEKFRQRRQQLMKLAALEADVMRIADELNFERRTLAAELRRCRSRDDFLVTSGPYIAWSRLAEAPRRTEHTGFYLPAGEHRLKYAIVQLQGVDRAKSLHAFTAADPRTLLESGSVDLPGSEAYELRVGINVDNDYRVSVDVLGKENRKLHENGIAILPGSQRHTYHQKDSERITFAFPSELPTTYHAKLHLRVKRSDPVTELLIVTTSRGATASTTIGAVGLRFWIESASPGCLSAITVADSYRFVATMNDNFATSYEDAFNELFQPYDGSGRYFFRDGVFSRPAAAEIDAVSP